MRISSLSGGAGLRSERVIPGKILVARQGTSLYKHIFGMHRGSC
jgi:hypothetical protein